MHSTSLFLLAMCAGAYGTILDVTRQLEDVVAGRINIALERLRLQPHGVSLSLLEIRRITHEPGQLELNIEATLETDGEHVCHLRLWEQTEERLEIVCAERKWQVVTPVEARASIAAENAGRWIDLVPTELSALQDRILRLVIRLQDELRDSVLLLPVRTSSARRQQTSHGIRTIIEARLGIPARLCELELIERPDIHERLVITCGNLQWETESTIAHH